MSSYYYNLIEDEKEARKERVGMRLATMLILFGVIVLGLNYFSREKLN
jgi:hypothetical protein